MSHGHDGHDGRGADPLATGYETRDASIRAIVTGGVVLSGFVVVITLGLLGYYDRLTHDDKAPPEQASAKEPLSAEVRSSDQRAQLLRLRAEEDAALSQYGWVDPKARVVRLPIDRAIELVAERGVPAGKGPKTAVEINSHAGTPAPPPVPGPLDIQSKGTEPKK